MPNLGPMEIFIILVVALIVFGPKKLPEIGRSIGKGLREFKKASNEVMSTLEAEDDEDDRRPHPKES
ncbi:MAG: preprotein translocase subunit TatA [Armatimonadetes bacterium RBG_16_58_9]|nr:MAG: preprotein translocase subunit TatA [Armatimonadetes bacterium RBG_16_58_9]